MAKKKRVMSCIEVNTEGEAAIELLTKLAESGSAPYDKAKADAYSRKTIEDMREACRKAGVRPII